VSVFVSPSPSEIFNKELERITDIYPSSIAIPFPLAANDFDRRAFALPIMDVMNGKRIGTQQFASGQAFLAYCSHTLKSHGITDFWFSDPEPRGKNLSAVHCCFKSVEDLVTFIASCANNIEVCGKNMFLLRKALSIPKGFSAQDMVTGITRFFTLHGVKSQFFLARDIPTLPNYVEAAFKRTSDYCLLMNAINDGRILDYLKPSPIALPSATPSSREDPNPS
jgi:hypothetical protein